MITIIHGDDGASSRNYFISQRQLSSDAIALNGATVTLNDVVQAVEGQGLFSEGKHIFIEELLSKRKASKELSNILECLLENQSSNEIFLWESKDLTVKQLSVLKAANVKQFKIAKTIFQFLDAIRPKNAKTMVVLLHRTLQTDEIEFVFYMLERHIRMLLALFEGDTDGTIEEVKRMAPWQKSKLQKQAKFFTIESLKDLYKKLLDIDVAQKTGGLALPLSETIDFLLLEI